MIDNCLDVTNSIKGIILCSCAIMINYMLMLHFSYAACCDFLQQNNLLSIIRAHEAQDAGLETITLVFLRYLVVLW
jgi:hypothetical protein